MRSLAVLLLTTITAGWAFAQQESIPLFPKIAIETNKGTIVVELDGNRAPITVSNFVTYVRDGHYDGTIFHRVIPGFVAQTSQSVTGSISFEQTSKSKARIDRTPSRARERLASVN